MIPMVHTNHNNNPDTPATSSSYNLLFSPAASSLGSYTKKQEQQWLLEVNWDPAQIRAELLQATVVLNHRCLTCAAKWTAEQVVGIPCTNSESSSPRVSPDLLLQEMGQLSPNEWYAKTLMSAGEYLHAASVLSEHSESSSMGMGMPRASTELSHYGRYLRAYALYLAGERRKEEDQLELQRYVTYYYECMGCIGSIIRDFASNRIANERICVNCIGMLLS